jgi:hypothetical protein
MTKLDDKERLFLIFQIRRLEKQLEEIEVKLVTARLELALKEADE